MLKEIINELFKKTEKTLEFQTSFALTEQALTNLPQELRSKIGGKLEEMRDCFYVESSYATELEANGIDKDTIEKLKAAWSNQEFEEKDETKNVVEDAFRKLGVNFDKESFLKYLKKKTKHYFPDKRFAKALERKIGVEKAAECRSLILGSVNFDYDKERGTYMIFRQPDKSVLLSDQLSSGEKQMIIILLKTLILKFKALMGKPNVPCILLMDEPEVSLHVEWQEELIRRIHQIYDRIQIIIATHSAGVMMGGWYDKVTKIESIRHGRN
jgi:predicted ATP-dependent endonuclease of OLD family